MSIKPHALLVEDHEANVMVMGAYLDHFGYTYDIARSGTEAVEKAKAGVYFVILMDVQMPVLDGFEATRRIREWEKESTRPYTPIVGITAHALVGDRERCLEAGMNDYISKPVRESKLMEILKQLETGYTAS